MKKKLLLVLLSINIFAADTEECANILKNADVVRKQTEEKIEKVLSGDWKFTTSIIEMFVNYTRMQQERYLICVNLNKEEKDK